MATALIAIAALIGGLILVAKAQGVDVGSEISDLGQSVTTEFSNLVGSGGDDALSLAVTLLKGFEGFSSKAYPDPPGSGKYSIGYGHQIKPGEPYNANSEIGEDEATQLLHTDAGTAYACVQNAVSVELTPQQTAALISFAYNEGCAAFGNSTLLQFVNQGDFESASNEFPKWIYEHINGVATVSADLQSRRAQEQELFNS